MTDALKAVLDIMAEFDIFDWSEFTTMFDVNMSITEIAKLMKTGSASVKQYGLTCRKVSTTYISANDNEPHPAQIILAIKWVRQITGLGLKDSKDAVDALEVGGPGKVLLTSVSKDVLEAKEAEIPFVGGYEFTIEELSNAA